MKKGNAFKIIISTSLVIVMAVAFMPIFGVSNANAATKKGRLVKSVTIQTYNKSKKKWINNNKMAFTYNKKNDPKKIAVTIYDGNGKHPYEGSTEKNRIKYNKKGVRISRSMTLEDSEGAVTTAKITYDKYGNPKKLTSKFVYEDLCSKEVTNYTRTKRGYLKKLINTKTELSDPEITTQDHFKYQVKQRKNNLLRRVEAECYDSTIKEWMKDSTFTYNAKGLLVKERRASASQTITYTYTWKKGRVTSVKITSKDDDGYVDKTKYKFTYTKKKVGKIRYAKMINELVAGDSDSNNYNLYSWY